MSRVRQAYAGRVKPGPKTVPANKPRVAKRKKKEVVVEHGETAPVVAVTAAGVAMPPLHQAKIIRRSGNRRMAASWCGYAPRPLNLLQTSFHLATFIQIFYARWNCRQARAYQTPGTRRLVRRAYAS